MKVKNNVHARFFITHGIDLQDIINSLISQHFIFGSPSEYSLDMAYILSERGKSAHDAYDASVKDIDKTLGFYHFNRLEVVGDYWEIEDPNDRRFGCKMCGHITEIIDLENECTYSDPQGLNESEYKLTWVKCHCPECGNTQEWHKH